MIGNLLAGLWNARPAKPDEEMQACGATRSSRWPTVRAKHLAANPTCACCGTKDALNVHHKLPFHLYPKLELEPTNLITLCEVEGRNCHLRIGHSFSWSAYNPNVVEDAALGLSRIANRKKA